MAEPEKFEAPKKPTLAEQAVEAAQQKLSRLRDAVEASKNSRREKVEIAGDPRVGTVIHFRQLHYVESGMDETMADQVFRTQSEILKDLKRMGVKDVFMEGLANFKGPSDLSEDDLLELMIRFHLEINDGFKDFPHRTNDTQKYFLTKYGGAMIYGALNEGVRLHVTQTPEQGKAIKKQMDTLMRSATKRLRAGEDLKSVERDVQRFMDSPQIMSDREKRAAARIKAFLKKNPGATVGLIFGADHDFKKHFQSGRAPVLKSVAYGD